MVRCDLIIVIAKVVGLYESLFYSSRYVRS